MTVSREMPRYKSHKIVWALKIADVNGCTITPADEGYAPFEVDPSLYLRYTPTAGDYFVQYEDGYKSFSPAKAFEEGYTSIDRENAAPNTPKQPITGYRNLSGDELALINEGKALAEQCGAFVAKLRRHPGVTPTQAPQMNDQLPPLDQRWVAIGATHLQEGFMAITRGIAQPTTF